MFIDSDVSQRPRVFVQIKVEVLLYKYLTKSETVIDGASFSPSMFEHHIIDALCGLVLRNIAEIFFLTLNNILFFTLRDGERR